MRRTATLLLILLSVFAALALADVGGSDFDSMPDGPYVGPADILEGNPANIQIRQVASGTQHQSPLPPNASGKMLCIDAVNKAERIIIEFSFSCGGDPSGLCQLKYDFGMAQWHGSGVEVHVDAGGDYSSPDDKIDLPVGFPPSTSAGDNTENEGTCDNSAHTVAFIVFPGSILYLDNLGTACLTATPTKKSTWGELKSRYW